jgi:hypothetical protein
MIIDAFPLIKLYNTFGRVEATHTFKKIKLKSIKSRLADFFLTIFFEKRSVIKKRSLF